MKEKEKSEDSCKAVLPWLDEDAITKHPHVFISSLSSALSVKNNEKPKKKLNLTKKFSLQTNPDFGLVLQRM